jgi:hypothetical protein
VSFIDDRHALRHDDVMADVDVAMALWHYPNYKQCRDGMDKKPNILLEKATDIAH